MQKFRSQNSGARRKVAGRGLAALFWLLATGFWISVHAEIIDRIAIAVGNQVITESQIDSEIRLTAFLNHDKPDFSVANRKAAAARLIEQALVKRDIELSRYPLPSPGDVEASLGEVKQSYGTESEYQKALQEYGITEDDLKARLLWQLTLLRFIDYRFRPGIQIPDADIKAYYDQELARWKQQDIQQIPTLEQARANIEEILTQQRIDEALDAWLVETRKQVTVNYLDEALK
jgi:peptidyl-prolyl cis-trans isomerase SurA